MNTYIVDTTLRDGEQAPGVIFTNHHKMEIARLLDQLGIEEVEVGTPAMGQHEQKVIHNIATSGFKFKTISWCRALTSDIDLASACKTDAVSISFPVSEIQLKSIAKDINWVKSEMPRLIAYARNLFGYVYVGLQDASRCEHHSLVEFIDIAFSSGANRVRIADTVGTMTPVDVMELFSCLSLDFPNADFEFHAHNDLGMATANAFMATRFGAKGISGTINGLGERAGNAAIEEFIMANFLENQRSSKYHTQIINKVCNLVAEASGRPLHPDKPICGSQVYAHETGIHVRSILKNKLSYQPFDEEIIGVKSNRIVIGKHSGRAALAYILQQHGQNPTSEQLNVMYQKVHESIVNDGVKPTDSYIMSLFQSLNYSPKC